MAAEAIKAASQGAAKLFGHGKMPAAAVIEVQQHQEPVSMLAAFSVSTDSLLAKHPESCAVHNK